VRRLFRRKLVRILTAMVSVTALAGTGIVASAIPAQAVGGTICLVSGTGCIGAPNLTAGSPVNLTASGRTINAHVVNGELVLQINAANNMCVGETGSNNSLLLVNCTNGFGRGWTMGTRNGAFTWADNDGNFITSADDVLGHTLQRLSSGFGFQRWSE